MGSIPELRGVSVEGMHAVQCVWVVGLQAAGVTDTLQLCIMSPLSVDDMELAK